MAFFQMSPEDVNSANNLWTQRTSLFFAGKVYQRPHRCRDWGASVLPTICTTISHLPEQNWILVDETVDKKNKS